MKKLHWLFLLFFVLQRTVPRETFIQEIQNELQVLADETNSE